MYQTEEGEGSPILRGSWRSAKSHQSLGATFTLWNTGMFSSPSPARRFRTSSCRGESKTICRWSHPAAKGAVCPILFFRAISIVRLDLSTVSPDALKWTSRLSYLVTFRNRYAVVQDAIIAHIKHRLGEMQWQKDSPFQPGQCVRLCRDHPLSLLDAVFEKPLSNGARAYILIEALGRLFRCEVGMSDLKSVEGCP